MKPHTIHSSGLFYRVYLKMYKIVVIALFVSLVHDTSADAVQIAVNWENVTSVSKTTSSLQVVTNPMLRRGSPIHNEIFDNLGKLNAEYVRYNSLRNLSPCF